MATIFSYGYMVTQNTNNSVVISKNGREIMQFSYSRSLSGKELHDLAFMALIR